MVRTLLESTNFAVDGPACHDMRVHNPALYPRIVRHGSLGLGEAYMDGWRDADAVDETIARILAERAAAAVAWPPGTRPPHQSADWATAHALLDDHPEDGPARFYRTRCLRYLEDSAAAPEDPGLILMTDK